MSKIYNECTWCKSIHDETGKVVKADDINLKFERVTHNLCKSCLEYTRWEYYTYFSKK